MVVTTKLFGTIDIENEKILTFEQGLIGFEDLKKFAILYDLESEERTRVSWLQSLDEPEMALPIINPFLVNEEYNPEISDSSLATLGEVKEENLNVLVTLTVPKEIEKMSCNLRAPLVINTKTRMGAQIITENTEYPIKFFIYDSMKAKKQIKEED